MTISSALAGRNEVSNMKFTVGTKWEREHIKTFAEMGIHEMFGSLRWSSLGTGRGGIVLPNVSREEARAYVEAVHAAGMKFCYVMNTSCLGNKEFDPGHITEILDELRFVDEIGIDSITVTVPSLIEIVKKNAPRLKVKASVINQICSVQSVRYFTSLGVDEITLGIDCNRDFELLEALRKCTDATLELLANEDCLFHCPYRSYHYNMQSHGSAKGDAFGNRYVDYCVMRCIRHRVVDHKEIIRARFIRPEDLGVYEALGIDKIKISSRHLPSEWGIRSARAYLAGRYDGNLADIISPIAMSIPAESMHKIEHWNDEEWNKLSAIVSTKGPDIFIDNRKLDGFLDHWVKRKKKCEQVLCGEECDYCGEVARRAVTPEKDENYTRTYLMMIDFMLDTIASGGIRDNKLWY